MKFLNLKNIKTVIYLNNITGLVYIVLLLVVLYFFINNLNQYNSYENRINTQVFELVKSKELNRKLFKNSGNNLYSNERPKIIDALYLSIRKSMLNIKEIKKSDLTKRLFLENKINLLALDYVHLGKQYDLFNKYKQQLGNSENGLYAKLLNSSNELFDRISTINNSEIITQYLQMKDMIGLFQYNSNKQTYEFLKKQINQIELSLNKEKLKNNNYKYLRVYDSFNYYQNIFRLFIKIKMQIGFNDNVGLTKKINENFRIIENRLNETSVVVYKKKHQNIIIFVILFVIISILFLLVSYYYSRKFYKQQSTFINRSIELIHDFDKGIFEKRKQIKLPLELKKVIDVINKFSNKLQRTEKVLLALPDRKINFEITDPNRIQFLDKSLLKIWKNFELGDNDLESEKEKRIVSDWIKTGLEKFTSILRKDFTNVNLLSKEILNNIIEHLNIAAGAIYLIKNRTESHGLDMVANFAFGKESHIKKEIDIGEGIIGTAAIEKKTLNITNIPSNYFKISSGFGSAMPKNLLIVPIKFENEFFGIIELASFRLIKSYELEFIEELGKAFAASLGANKVHQEVREEYENFIKKSKIVENENIKLENKITNINNDYEKLLENNAEFEVIYNNLDNTTIIFDINIEGYIISVNNQFYRTYKILPENINTTNYLDLVYKSEKIDEIDIDKFWSDIKLGATKKIVHKINISNEVFWLSDSFIPIYNNGENIKNIKVISTNITDYKKLEEIIENANINIQELKLSNENNDAFINKLKLQLKNSKSEIEKIKIREKELLELINELKNK